MPVFRHPGITALLLCLLPGLLACGPGAADGQASPADQTPHSTSGQQPAWHAVVLMYHHVARDTPPLTSVTPEQFSQHLQWLQQMGMTVVPLAQVLQAVRGHAQLPPNAVAITFDDGYSSVYQNALPILRAARVPFTVFVNADAHSNQAGAYMSWAQLRELEAAGGSIANHSASHPHLPLFDGDLDAELLGAQQRLEAELAAPLRVHAYPYGEASANAREVLAKAGFLAFGQHSGAIGPLSDPLNLPRFPMAAHYAEREDFMLKVATLPLPVAHQAALPVGVLHSGAPAPVLELELAAMPAGTLHCFASGQGRTRLEWTTPDRVQVQAHEPLRPGRSRYNCTAASGAAPLPAPEGASEPLVQRFHWFSHQWLVTRGWQPD